MSTSILSKKRCLININTDEINVQIRDTGLVLVFLKELLHTIDIEDGVLSEKTSHFEKLALERMAFEAISRIFKSNALNESKYNTVGSYTGRNF
jgi:hypothetical protein